MPSDNKKPSDLRFVLKPSSEKNCANLRPPGLLRKPSAMVFGVPEDVEIGSDQRSAGLELPIRFR
jgi:hypothetical protein